MAKRSSAQAIKSKQSSAYRSITRTAPAIHAMQSLKGFPGSSNFISPEQADKAAEAIMSAGWKRSRNPICSSCYVMKAINGSCGCSE